jgi:hypothetical protein
MIELDSFITMVHADRSKFLEDHLSGLGRFYEQMIWQFI